MVQLRKKQTGTESSAPDQASEQVKTSRIKCTSDSERTRALICQSAAEVIGEVGYANASVSRIMNRAGLANGTFYNYFESRQDLFDILLPMKGKEMLQHLNARANSALGIIEVESRAFLSFFQYVQNHPWFFRLLHEAPVATPHGYRTHLNFILSRYRHLLADHHSAGEMPAYDETELDAIAFMLMSARDSACAERVAMGDDRAPTIEGIARTYKKFISYGLRGAGDAEIKCLATRAPKMPRSRLRARGRLRRSYPESDTGKLLTE